MRDHAHILDTLFDGAINVQAIRDFTGHAAAVTFEPLEDDGIFCVRATVTATGEAIHIGNCPSEEDAEKAVEILTAYASNTNCLEGMMCPKCGHCDSFHITATSWAFIQDDGIETYGNTEYSTSAACQCGNCQHVGTVAEFTFAKQFPA